MRMYDFGAPPRIMGGAAPIKRTKKFPVRFRAGERGKYTGKHYFAMKDQNAEIGISGSSSDFSMDFMRT